mmetsp:Transcript_20458/g.31989  ORF Transcript_20458/g.31989 Transcript_20458/m.31989 type:complete len:99 (-) Transcript_20458:245-541(-)
MPLCNSGSLPVPDIGRKSGEAICTWILLRSPRDSPPPEDGTCPRSSLSLVIEARVHGSDLWCNVSEIKQPPMISGNVPESRSRLRFVAEELNMVSSCT